MSLSSSHGNNADLRNEEVQEQEEEDQVQTSLGKKRTETQRSSSDFPPRKKLAQGFNIWDHFTPVKDDRESTDEDSDSDDSHGNLTPPAKCDQEVFKKAVIEMIVLSALPFSFVEAAGFRRFCDTVMPMYEDISRETVMREIVEMFRQEKDALKKLFSNNKMRVSLTTDTWASPTNSDHRYMVITAFWIDANWKLQKRIISFKLVTDTVERHLIECLDEWGIEKVFTVTVDNAEGNDQALTLFRDAMRLKGANALVKDGEFLHMRCCGNIVNLIVKDSLERGSDSIVAVRNAVKYVQSCFTRLKSFELCLEMGEVPKGNLSLDCVTEWNSTYLMLIAALKLKVGFEKMVDEDKLYGEYFLEIEEETGKKRIGPPSSDTWDEVVRLVKFLTIFFDCTLEFSAPKSAASSIGYSEIVTIESNLISLSNSVDEEVKKQATSIKDKFEKYWDGLMNINPLVIVASVFDPRKKMKFASLCFNKLHGKDSLETNHLTSSVKSVMRQLYEEYIIMVNDGTQSNHEDSEESSDDGYIKSDSLYKEMIYEMRKEEAGRELDTYLMERVEPWSSGSDYDVLSWWKRNSSRFPILSELARDVLAIQMSCFASESAFCTNGRSLDTYRSSLTPFFTEVMICTQQWLKSSLGHDDEQLPSLEQIFEELDFNESLDPRNQPESDSDHESDSNQ